MSRSAHYHLFDSIIFVILRVFVLIAQEILTVGLQSFSTVDTELEGTRMQDFKYYLCGRYLVYSSTCITNKCIEVCETELPL